MLPESLESVGLGCFQKDAKLREVDLPSGVTHLGADFFLGCTSLRLVVIPNPEAKFWRPIRNLTGLLTPKMNPGLLVVGPSVFAPGKVWVEENDLAYADLSKPWAEQSVQTQHSLTAYVRDCRKQSHTIPECLLPLVQGIPAELLTVPTAKTTNA